MLVEKNKTLTLSKRALRAGRRTQAVAATQSPVCSLVTSSFTVGTKLLL